MSGLAYFLAGVEGVEPSSGVLETLILPMNYTPKHINNYNEMIFFVNVFMLKYLNICPISVILILVMEEKKFNVTIYTDGACSGNPGAGGWGAILMSGETKKEFSGFEKETTNNKMELTAVIEALKKLKKPCNVKLYSDSAYVVNAFLQGWLENWKNNGWRGADKKPVKNIELWTELDELLKVHSVEFIKVKGHADNEFNNRCDALATGEIAKNQS